MAYSVLAGICIPPFCRTRCSRRATPRVEPVCALDQRHLYLCVPAPRGPRRLPARGPSRRRRRRPTAREGPRRRRRDWPTRRLMIPICREFGVPLHHERLAGAGPRRRRRRRARGSRGRQRVALSRTARRRRDRGALDALHLRVRRCPQSVGDLLQRRARSSRRPPNRVAPARASATPSRARRAATVRSSSPAASTPRTSRR